MCLFPGLRLVPGFDTSAFCLTWEEEEAALTEANVSGPKMFSVQAEAEECEEFPSASTPDFPLCR